MGSVTEPHFWLSATLRDRAMIGKRALGDAFGLDPEVDALARAIAGNAPLAIAAFKAATRTGTAPAPPGIARVAHMVEAC